MAASRPLLDCREGMRKTPEPDVKEVPPIFFSPRSHYQCRATTSPTRHYPERDYKEVQF